MQHDENQQHDPADAPEKGTEGASSEPAGDIADVADEVAAESAGE